MIKKAKLILSSYRESLAMHGRINPVTYIFMSKNFDGLKDTQTQELEILRADQVYTANMTPEQIEQRIQADIPLDDDPDNTAEIVP